MSDKELLTVLYERMAAEQEHYRQWLLEQPPGEILNHAYEFSVREDILMEMESLELSEAQTKALLKSRAPMADIYKTWEKIETHHMDDIREVIENRADYVVRTEKAKSQREAR